MNCYGRLQGGRGTIGDAGPEQEEAALECDEACEDDGSFALAPASPEHVPRGNHREEEPYSPRPRGGSRSRSMDRRKRDAEANVRIVGFALLRAIT